MSRLLRKLRADTRGATLVETTLVFPLLVILTFGMFEFGVAFWEYQSAEKATAVGARWVATRHGVAGAAAVTTELYTTAVPDCFVATSKTPGTPCSQVDGATDETNTKTCTGAGGGACSSAVMGDLLAEMRRYAPFLAASNVTVEFRGSSMGFVGRGRAVPLVTVRTTDLTYNFIALDELLGLGPITMPSFATTLPAEDQKEGPGI